MQSQVQIENSTISFSGSVVFSTVQKLQDQIKKAPITSSQGVLVDFSRVDQVDTSALALCLSIKRLYQNSTELIFENVPQSLLDIAESVGVKQLFDV